MLEISLDNRTKILVASSELAAISILLASGYKEAAKYLVAAYFPHINDAAYDIVICRISKEDL